MDGVELTHDLLKDDVTVKVDYERDESEEDDEEEDEDEGKEEVEDEEERESEYEDGKAQNGKQHSSTSRPLNPRRTCCRNGINTIRLAPLNSNNTSKIKLLLSMITTP